MNKTIGINAVCESLSSKRVQKLYLTENFTNPRVLGLAKQNNVSPLYLSKKEFAMKFPGNTQGCVAEVIPFKTYSLVEVIDECKTRKNPIIVILDELKDPHNLGAILRSSDVFDVTAIIYKNRREVSLNETVAKVSTGAINYVKCCEVTNLSQTISALKKNGFWIIGLDGDARDDLKKIPRDVPLAIVVGSEGYGIAQLVKQNCDMLAKIPMNGHVSCLNASVSCAIVLYELRNR